jgi:CRP-like cAMP-binding protein
MVGTSRVRVNQALLHFRALGYISVDQGNRITVHDRAALAARCS